MTAGQFAKWLEEMRFRGKIKTKADAARLLGKSTEMIRLYERDGTRELQTDLACAALLKGTKPYA